MILEENKTLKARIDRIRHLCVVQRGSVEYFEAASLAQTVLPDTVGGAHPLMKTLQNALEAGDWVRDVGASRGVVTLFDAVL